MMIVGYKENGCVHEGNEDIDEDLSEWKTKLEEKIALSELKSISSPGKEAASYIDSMSKLQTSSLPMKIPALDPYQSHQWELTHHIEGAIEKKA